MLRTAPGPVTHYIAFMCAPKAEGPNTLSAFDETKAGLSGSDRGWTSARKRFG
jgi:hypothetical protein